MAEEGVQLPSPEKVTEKLPFVKYRGAIKYYTDGNEIAEASDYLM